LGEWGEFRLGNPRVGGLTTESTEGHRGLLGIYAFSVGRLAAGGGLGTVVVHSPRIAQGDFSVKVRCHKEKIKLWKTFGVVEPSADKGRADGQLSGPTEVGALPG
jgi:hypothetical protein